MMVSIQVDASYRTMENGRLRKESRVFSQEQSLFIVWLLRTPAHPSFSRSSTALGLTQSISQSPYKRSVEIYLNGDVFLLIFTGWGHLFMARRDSNSFVRCFVASLWRWSDLDLRRNRNVVFGIFLENVPSRERFYGSLLFLCLGYIKTS